MLSRSLLLAALALTACTPHPAESASSPTQQDESTPSPTPTRTPTREPAPDFPRDVARPEQGGRYWAVVLAAGDRDAIDASVRSVARYGYDAGYGDLACLGGAPEAYDLPRDIFASSLLFADERRATAFTAAYGATGDGDQLGIAKVTAYCLD